MVTWKSIISQAVDPLESLKMNVEHCPMPVWSFHSTLQFSFLHSYFLLHACCRLKQRWNSCTSSCPWQIAWWCPSCGQDPSTLTLLFCATLYLAALFPSAVQQLSVLLVESSHFWSTWLIRFQCLLVIKVCMVFLAALVEKYHIDDFCWPEVPVDFS